MSGPDPTHAGRRQQAPRRAARRGALRGEAGDRRPGPHGRAGDDLPARPRPLPHRGRARPREDADGVDARPGRRRIVRPPAVHARPRARPTSSAPACGARRAKSSTSSGDRCSRTSSSPTRSTARPPRCSRRCSRSWPSATCRSRDRPAPTPTPFLVLATQNPIESEGVYALPEAQRDRFLMQIVVQPAVVRRRARDRAPDGRAGRPRPTQMLTIEQLVELQGAVDDDLRAPRGAGLRGAARHGDA